MNSKASSLLRLFAARPRPEPQEARSERFKVREFLITATREGFIQPQPDSWLTGFSADFSAEVGARGWIGMTWPARYGGREFPNQVRYAVVEELVGAGAPVAAHWFADRQVGPALLRHGTEYQRGRFLPQIAKGRMFFCIGMSEPESGSDLGSVHTSAQRTGDGWQVNGSKIWTSHADKAHFMLALVRTGGREDPRSAALTQLIIDMDTPGLTVRPIPTMDGGHHFCEVFFDDVLVPDSMVLGTPGAGWRQVLDELTHERSGPERFLSTFHLLAQFAQAAETLPRSQDDWHVETGQLVSRLGALRAMSERINTGLECGEPVGAAAALVKDMGTRFETEVIETVRTWLPAVEECGAGPGLRAETDAAQARAPAFTLRGGANEILRGIVARELGLR